MDPITVIGLASALVTFIDFSAKVIKRLDELSQVGEVPKCFKDVKIRLPLVVNIVEAIQRSQDKLDKSVQPSVDAVIRACDDQVQQLETILNKVTVGHGDSAFKKGLKVFTSFKEEKRVQEISVSLRDNIQILTSLNIATSRVEEDVPHKLTRRSSVAPPPYSEVAPQSSQFMLPFTRDEHFVGREKILSSIEGQFLERSRVAVVGMGGVGKSQVAIEYAYRFHASNPRTHVFWVYGGSVARFYQGYKRIAQKLKLPSWDDPDVSILELVNEWFNDTDEAYLLIIDNADDITHYWPAKYKHASKGNEPATDLSRYLPEDNECGKTLITSRDSRVAGRLVKRGQPILLQPLSKDEAIHLFLSADHLDPCLHSDDSVQEIVQALDFLPLAISQAASFIAENSITPTEYLNALHEDDVEAEEFLNEELDDARRDEESVNSAFRAWKVTFDQIAKQKPQAVDLLYLLALLDRQSIPRWLVAVPGAVISLGILQAFHMITARAGSETFQLHRLTQRFVQMSLKSQGKLQHWQDAALECVSKAYPTEIGVAEWPTCDTLSPHVQVVTSYQQTSSEARLNLANLLCWAADYDVERGLYGQAIRRAKWSLDLYREMVPETDQRLAAATWLYGRLLFYEADSTDDIKAAETHLQAALKIADPDSITYAETTFELAYIYYSQSRESECLQMAQKNADCWQRISGPSGVRTLDERHDYALQLAMFGHGDEAVAHWQDILRLTPMSDATDDTKLVFTYRSTACIAEFQGDHEMAEDLYSKLVTLCSAIYNAEHVHVFDYQLSEAEQVLRQNKDAEALELTEVILENCQNKSEWRITASCFQIIAECYRLMQDYEHELEFRHKCLALYRQKLGATYADTYDSMELVARCLVKQGDFGQALALAEQVLDWRSRTLGREHTDTIIAAQLVAFCGFHGGRSETAEHATAQEPPNHLFERPRFGRIIHPKTWSS